MTHEVQDDLTGVVALGVDVFAFLSALRTWGKRYQLLGPGLLAASIIFTSTVRQTEPSLK